jgi:hypothetical protein
MLWVDTVFLLIISSTDDTRGFLLPDTQDYDRIQCGTDVPFVFASRE